MKYKTVLHDSIRTEERGEDYICNGNDRYLLVNMLDEINCFLGTNVHYLAEIDLLDLTGSGPIMAKYIDKFQSDSVRCYLVPHIVADRVTNGAEILLKSYIHFKESSEYISAPKVPAPAHIYVRYDNAFATLKPKKLKDDLLNLLLNPRDAFYLPFTMRMLSSWKLPELEIMLTLFLDEDNITYEMVGLNQNSDDYYPPLSFIKKQLKLTAIDCLKYYPSDNTVCLLNACSKTEDKDIISAIKKSLKYITKKM